MWCAVLDTETTGLEETDQVVEVALVFMPAANKDHSNPIFWRSWSSLVRPTCPVSHEARAAHHITDTELSNAPRMHQTFVQDIQSRLKHDDIVLVGHFLDFDKRMMRQSGASLDFITKNICTHQCAKHLYPDAPRHSNQVLRYFLDLVVPKQKLPPHRALPDAMVTAGLLAHMLKTNTIEQLITLTTTPVLLKTIDNGQYEGKLWAEVKDMGWLDWVIKQDGPKGFSEDKRYTARCYLDKLKQEKALKIKAIQEARNGKQAQTTQVNKPSSKPHK